MINSEMQKQINKLVNEIFEDEATLANAEAEAARVYITESSRKRYNENVENLKQRIDRKIEVLKVLRGA